MRRQNLASRVEALPGEEVVASHVFAAPAFTGMLSDLPPATEWSGPRSTPRVSHGRHGDVSDRPLKSASRPKPDIAMRPAKVRFVPTSELQSSL
jgi:hypothetical protein